MTGKKKKRNFKYWIGRLHLWLGLASGLIVLLLSVTGCLYVFNEEITNWLRKDEIYVHQESPERLPLSTLWNETQAKVGTTYTITNATLYSNPNKSCVFHCYKFGQGKLLYYDNIDQYVTIYTNPYTGKITGIYNEKADFFVFVKALHWSLLLATPVGQPIVGWATFIFVIMLISGIILWWPKNKAARKQRLWFQWKDSTKWRRKNYDLHNIFGFYIAILALIIAFTGMTWAFTWFQSAVYVAGSGSLTPPEVMAEKSVPCAADKDMALDKACTFAMRKYKNAASFDFGKPADSLAPLEVYVGLNQGTYYASNRMQFDQYSGKLLAEKTQDEKNFGEKLVTANYDIHVGAILGLPGKIMAFTASFISGMLPVTGFMIWRGRKNKKQKGRKH